jgi:hypothetical protein
MFNKRKYFCKECTKENFTHYCEDCKKASDLEHRKRALVRYHATKKLKEKDNERIN